MDTEIDWVIKRKLFQRYQDRYNMELSDPKISQLDLAYHDIKRGRGGKSGDTSQKESGAKHANTLTLFARAARFRVSCGAANLRRSRPFRAACL